MKYLPFDLDLEPQKLRDSFRLGLQCAIAASLCFIIIGMIGSDEAFVGVLSAVMIVQPSIGRTIGEGWERLLATLVGCGVGLTCLFLLPPGYGVAIALAVVMFVMNFIAGFRPSWRQGVVAAVALALADTSGDVDVAQARSIAIGVGIAVGIVVSFVVWPESASRRGLRHRWSALEATADRFEAALQDETDTDLAEKARKRFHTALSSGRNVIGSSKTQDTRRLHRTFDAIEELYNSIIVVARIESPLSYFDGDGPERREMIETGRDAILSLSDDQDEETEEIREFSKSVESFEAGLSQHQIDKQSGKYAASIVFGLREMERALQNFVDRNKRKEADKSAVQKLSPVNL